MLLLVVLSMLMLFLMIGTAFIVTSKQSEKQTKHVMATAIADTNAAARGELLNDVMLQLLRDTDNPNSVLRYHSLLGDMYGNEGFIVTDPGIQMVQWAKATADAEGLDTGIPAGLGAGIPGGVTGGQMVQFDVFLPSLQDLYGLPYHVQFDPVAGTSTPTLSSNDGAYNGQVVTFLNGAARGVSTRIVDYRVNTAGAMPRYQFTVMAFPLADGSLIINAPGGPRALIGSRILVNGRAFNGTGVGYNTLMTTAPPTQPRLNLFEGVLDPSAAGGVAHPELALLPNATFFDFTAVHGSLADPTPIAELLLTASQRQYLIAKYPGTDHTDPTRAAEATQIASVVGPPGFGGQNEAYDAADFQNYYMALIQDQPEDSNPPGGSLQQMVLPSFHRPELINYWRNRLATTTPLELNPMMLRKVMARPSWFDHPNFTGSNSGMVRWHEEFRTALLNAEGDLSDPNVQRTSLRLLIETTPAPDTDPRSNDVIHGPWDVDNDGDGNRDSIWVDFGAPVIMGPNGKLVKPLAAILCLDLDGRVNVNTAGTLDMAMPGAKGGMPDGLRVEEEELRDRPDLPGLGKRLAGNGPTGQSWDNVARGVGWGPAEIGLAGSLGPTSHMRLVTGGTVDGKVHPGRYGRDLHPVSGLMPFMAVPGRPGYDFVGQPGFDFFGQATRFGWPQWGVQGRSSFGSQPDLRARYGIGLNDYGQFVSESQFDQERPGVNNNLGVLTADSPYEAAIYAEGTDVDNGYLSTDAPFSVAELERVLREHDTDATTLPSRLDDLRRMDGGVEPGERNRITVESWQTPTATIHVPPDLMPLMMAGAPVRPQTPAEVMEMRVRAALNRTDAANYPLYPAPLADNPPAEPVTPAKNVRRIVRQLLARELAAGKPLDVNRPIGNGRDDSLPTDPGFGVVDEPGEDWLNPARASTPQASHVWQVKARADVDSFDAVGGETLDINFQAAQFRPLQYMHEMRTPGSEAYFNEAYDSLLQRQLLARDLYVTALMMSAPPNYGANLANDRRLAERIAQWAVNAVDFRDADATMTGFEYDVYPFDGWHVNGLINGRLPGPDGRVGTPDDLVGGDKLVGGDGVLGTADDVALPMAMMDDQRDDRGVVWGVERPELVINETFAMHDRNTTDEADEDPNPGEEPGDSSDPLNEANGEFDQKYRPRGAFFLELYNPWAANPAVSGDTHLLGEIPGDVKQTIDFGVDLAKDDPATHTSPVWRITVAPIANPTDLVKDPDDLVARNRPTAPERVIYFSGYDPDDRSDRNPAWVDEDGDNSNGDVVAFYNNAVDGPRVYPVRPGRYTVVGSGKKVDPGVEAYFSPLGQVYFTGDVVDVEDRPPLRGIELRPVGNPTTSTVRLLDQRAPGTPTANMYLGWSRDTPPGALTVPVEAPREVDALGAGVNFPADVGRPDYSFPPAAGSFHRVDTSIPAASKYIADVAIIDRVTRAGAPVERRLTISEPAAGYPHSVGNVAWVDMEAPGVPRGMRDPNEDGYYALGAGRDADGLERGNPSQPKPIDTPLDDIMDGDGPNVLQEIGTHANYKQVFLQRLANPLLPFDPASNPYRTVDRSAVNLTVYNGRLSTTQTENGNRNNVVQGGFSSLERGYRFASFRTPPNENDDQDFNLWAVQPVDDQRRLRGEAGPDYDASRRGKRLAGDHRGAPYSLEFLPPLTLGFVNRTFMTDDPGTASNRNVNTKRVRPVDPLPWFTWNNRPYVSGNELMLAPSIRSSQLLQNFSMPEDGSESAYEEALNVVTSADDFDVRQPIDSDGYPPFTHLENFLYEHDLTVSERNNQPPRLYRLLELVGTPSLYAGAQTWLNPTRFSLPLGAAPLMDDDPRRNRQPPFNNVSMFREPGRINLNTVASDRVYADLFQADDSGDVSPESDDNHPGPEWDDFIESRRGYGGGGDMLALNSGYPTFFVNPFRPSTMAAMVPLQNMVQTEDGSELHGSEATLFRSQDAAWNEVDDEPLFAADTDDDHNNAERNAFFQYAPLTRLQNLTGTHSNVFAVWITIGFFEVEEADLDRFTAIHESFGLPAAGLQTLYNRVYPDGYTFGKEDGLDEGNVRRMRGFYIIDRSRPAAFDPGVDRNVENTIRLRRRIE